MGKEYRLVASDFNRKVALDFVKRRLVVANHLEPLLGVALPVNVVEDWKINTEPNWPAVMLAIEPGGFYFCDNLTSPKDASLILRVLIDFLLSNNTQVEIKEI